MPLRDAEMLTFWLPPRGKGGFSIVLKEKGDADRPQAFDMAFRLAPARWIPEPRRLPERAPGSGLRVWRNVLLGRPCRRSMYGLGMDAGRTQPPAARAADIVCVLPHRRKAHRGARFARS